VSCSDEDEKPRKRRRTNSSSSSPVVLKEVPKAVVPVSKTITVPVSGSPKMSNIMQSIANSLPPHMSPVKITFTKPSTQTTNTTTQKVIIVTTSPSSTFVPNILSKSHNYAAVTKLVPTSVIASTTQKPPVVITASQSSLVSSSSSGSSSSAPSPIPSTVAVTAVVSSTPSVVMSTVAQGVSTSAIKMASTRLPSPKSLVGAPTQILAQFPKQHQQSPKQQLHQVQQQTQQQVAQPAPVSHQQQPQQSPLPPGIKPTIQIKQESGNWKMFIRCNSSLVTTSLKTGNLIPPTYTFWALEDFSYRRKCSNVGVFLISFLLCAFFTQALSSHTAFTKHSEELGTEEGEVEEMDTLDPQTGLFYRSALTQSQSAKQQKLSQPQLEQTQLQVKTLQCFQTKQKQTIHLQADQLQHKLPQMPQLSIRHQKLTPLQQEQAQPKPDVQHTQHPMVAKDRQLPTLMAQPPQTVVQVLAVKTTQQLPKLQQAPNQPKIYVQPQTPQSQMPLPAASEKQPASQVEQPIITQGSSVTKITFEGRQPPTVTKITGGSSVPKLTSPVTSISPIQASEKTAVSDILKMSLMEAQIDTNVEHMVVDPPKKALATSMLTGEAGSLPSTHVVVAGMANSTPQQQKCRESCSSPSAVGPPLTTRKIDAPGVPATGQFMRIQNVGQKKAEESPAEIIIQAIPQYAIPCHSSSNVVVEPSGLLELNNFTSQQLDDDETAMEQDIDSSTEDGTEPSPSQSSAERS
ncbi:BRCA2-interacting transcriptional repressor EMSY-like, partial [Leptonychotes weddellii]|uniref:BRCA2-interacting transcriptional repressor EMSY-like n=1 Tax=Leptonychotes weddellii TaxID=9713 RepID=A0A7F8RVQ1_LEPWE